MLYNNTVFVYHRNEVSMTAMNFLFNMEVKN